MHSAVSAAAVANVKSISVFEEKRAFYRV